MRSQIVDEIAVVTINPTRRDVRVFDASAIDVAWKLDTPSGENSLPRQLRPRRP